MCSPQTSPCISSAGWLRNVRTSIVLPVRAAQAIMKRTGDCGIDNGPERAASEWPASIGHRAGGETTCALNANRIRRSSASKPTSGSSPSSRPR